METLATLLSQGCGLLALLLLVRLLVWIPWMRLIRLVVKLYNAKQRLTRRYMLLTTVIGCAFAGLVPWTTLVRLVAIVVLRWKAVNYSKLNFTRLRTPQSKIVFAAMLLGLYSATLLYHMAYNSYTDNITGRARIILTGRHIEGRAGQHFFESIKKEQDLLPSTHPDYKLVASVGNKLVQATGTDRPGRHHLQWEFAVINSTEVNAFALPGGKVAVHRGLIEQVHRSEEALAFVIGHELGHALLRHSFETSAFNARSTAAKTLAPHVPPCHLTSVRASDGRISSCCQCLRPLRS